MATFATFSPFLSSWEGGYANNPNDRGGETYRGVTARTWAAYCAQHGITSPLRKMTQAQWADLMQTGYWDTLRASSLRSQSVANQVSDFAVNAGVSRAARTLQQAVNAANHNTALAVDGRVGAKTIAAANALSPSVLYWTFRDLRTAYYRSLAASSPRQATFLRGWLRRTAALGFGKYILNDLRSSEIRFAEEA